VPTYSTTEISRRVDGQLSGPADLAICGAGELHEAEPGQITFIGDAKHCRHWPESSASAALVGADLAVEAGNNRALIRVPDADLAMVTVLEMFAPPAQIQPVGVHPAATVDPSAVLGENVSVGPHAVIGRDAKVDDRTVIHAGVVLLDDVTVGADCVVWPGTVVRERCRIGENCILHPNVTIGADGFGFRPSADGSRIVKIPHIGSVVIGRDVEIGAGTCVDRGKFSATSIGDGTKIDNLCQIAHNCWIGRGCLIAGCTAIGGSVRIGDGTIIGGNVSVKDHLTIGNRVILAARSGVINDVPDGVTWGGTPAHDIATAIREQIALRKLPDLIKTLRHKS
jgi:UDP-3-O-[3-hydroxymyristoyl] glucosamine N-acyltransferase